MANEQLVVAIEARIRDFERQMQKATATAGKQATAIEKRFALMNRRSGIEFGAIGRRAIGIFGGALTLQAAQRLIDASTRVENSLKVAGLSGQELARVYDSLFASAQQNAAPLEALVELYGRASLVQKELGVSTKELLGFTDNIAIALRVSGKSATESSGALLQLSQALGSGIVRAEEFNSILEGALPIAQAAAAGLDEAGGSVAKLRALVVDGKVSSEAFFRAFEAGSVILKDKVAGAELTVAQGFTRLTNVLIKSAGQFDDATGTSEGLASALDSLAGSIGSVGQFFEDNSGAIRGFNNLLADTLGYALALVDVLPKATGLSADKPPGWEELNARFGVSSTKPAGPTGRGGRRGKPAAQPVETVSLEDFRLPDSDTAAKAAERHAESVRGLIADLEQQRSVMGLTSLEQEIANTLYRAGVDGASEQGQAIASLVTDIDAQRTAIEANTAAMEAFGQAAQDALSTFVDDMLAGKNLAESFGGILKNLGGQLLNAGLGSLFSPGPSNLFGIPGRAAGGAVQAGRPYIVGERRPELFVPDQPGRIVPNLNSLPKMGAGGGTSVSISIPIDARGADSAAIARLEGGLARMKAELPSTVVAAVRNARARRAL